MRLALAVALLGACSMPGLAKAPPISAVELATLRTPKLAPLAEAVGKQLAGPDAAAFAGAIGSDATESFLRGAGSDACGAPEIVSHSILRQGRCVRRSVYYLYDPRARAYSLGGWIEAGTEVEALATRTDGFLAIARTDGRVQIVAPSTVVLETRVIASAPAPYTTGPAPVSTLVNSPTAAAYAYEKVEQGGALLHIVRASTGRVSVSEMLAPFYDTLQPGHDRTLPVDVLATRADANVAVNGTFFIDAPDEPQYGYPLGCVIRNGRLAWDAATPDLLHRRRSYIAFTDDRRIVLGDTDLSGKEIMLRNAAGTFDPARLGAGKIQSLLGGIGWLVKDGQEEAWRSYAGVQFDPSFYARSARRARTLLGVDAAGRSLVIVAQEEGSLSPDPLSIPELAPFMARTLGAHDAVFLDGGGSTQMVIEGRTVTRPFDGGYRKNSTALVLDDRPASH